MRAVELADGPGRRRPQEKRGGARPLRWRLKLVDPDEVRVGEKTDVQEQHGNPHHGGDRLSSVEVVFEVASQRYPIDERAATLMAEHLRVKAVREPGAEGAGGARAVADAIELRLTEETANPITLGGDGADAVFYAQNISTETSAQLQALYDAVTRLHDEPIR